MSNSGYDLRLVAYGAFGQRIGPVPAPLTWTWTLAQYGWPVLTIDYPESAVRSSILESRCELAVEFKDYDGTWVETDNCRLLRVGRSWDRKGKARVRSYRFHGMGWINTRLLIRDASTQDPGDGPRKPVRIFTDPTPGQMLVPLANAAYLRAFPITDPITWVHPPEKDFELLEDTNNVAWDDTSILPGEITFDVTQRLSDVERVIVEANAAEPVWWKRTYRLYNWETYGRDLSTGDAIVSVRDSTGVTASPESQGDDDLAARVLVVGSNGRYTVKESDNPELAYGYLEDAVSAPWASDLDALEKSGRWVSRRGRVETEQLTREGVIGDSGPCPLRDWRVSDRVRLQRGNDLGSSRFVTPICTEMSITKTAGKGITWHAKFGDRHEDRQARALGRLNRLTVGTKGGKVPDEPPADGRQPHPPLDVVVTTVNDVDPNGKTVATQTITWTNAPYLYNPDDPGDLSEPLNLGGTVVGLHRFGVVATLTTVGPDETSWTWDNQQPRLQDLTVAHISHSGIQGPWADQVPADIPRDDEPGQGKNLVLDDRFVNPPIRDKRSTFAGSGFGFEDVDGRKRAVFTDVAPVLRTRIGGLDTSGYFPVRPGEKYLVGGTARKIGSPNATIRFGVQWRDADGTSTDVGAIVEQVVTGTDTRYVAEWTVPAGAVDAAWRASGFAFDSGARVEVIDPVLERRTSTERLEDGSLTLEKFIDRVIEGVKIKLATILGENVAARTIAAGNIVANTITAGEIAAHTITAAEIAALTITANELAANSITTSKIIADAVDNDKIAPDAVGTLEIQGNVDIDGTLTTAGGGTTVGGLSADQINMLGGGAIQDGGGGAMNFIGGGSWNFHDDGTYTGTWVDVSTRESKVNVKPVALDLAKRLLGIKPVMYKRRESWSRKWGEQHIEARDVIDKRTGKKVRRKARTIPGKVDKRQHVGLIAEDVEAAGLDVLVSRSSGVAGVDYPKVSMFLLALVQDLYAKVERLEGQSDQDTGSDPAGA